MRRLCSARDQIQFDFLQAFFLTILSHPPFLLLLTLLCAALAHIFTDTQAREELGTSGPSLALDLFKVKFRISALMHSL